MTEATGDSREHRSSPAWTFAVVVTAVDVGVALAAFAVARDAGASEAAAYLIGAVGPVLGAVLVWLRSRQVSGASIAILAFTLLSSGAALVGSHEPSVLLYKDAVVTGLVGLVFAGSLLLPRPLAFWFGQRFATDGTREGVARWDAMWQYPLFRHAQRVITTVWAVTYVVEAAVKAYVIGHAGFDAAYTTDQLLPFVAAGVAVLLTVLLARHYWRVAESRQGTMA